MRSQTGTFETLLSTEEAEIVRLHGRLREPIDGRHRELVVYVAPTVTTRRLVDLLRAAADQLAKTMPRWSE